MSNESTNDLPLDAAALDRWSALLARIIDHSDGTRPFAEVYDDELEPFIAQSRAALKLRARVAELERELNGVREASASELSTAYKRVAELEQESLRYYAADGSFVEMESAEAVVAARIEAAKRVAELERACDDEAASNDSLRRMYLEQAATANALREALERLDAIYRDDVATTVPRPMWLETALASTPAASLAAHDAEVMERAQVAAHNAIHDAVYEKGECDRIKAAVDDAIRALAAQEVKP